MAKNVKSPTSTHCSGCGACSVVCPVQAIKIVENSEGFLEPVINDKCVDCGICQTVCCKYQSVNNLPTLNDTPCYAAYSADYSIHQSTTSGGFAYELSKWGIENGFKIVGVVYDYESDRARTVIVDSIQNLHALKGSKYIQSYTEEAFRALCELAQNNKEERFICFGTPCQIYGLRRLVDKKRLCNNFIYVDLYCHGVPSYLVWEPYIKKHRAKLGSISKLNFRYKGNGWHQYSIKIQGDRGEYCNFAYNDIFYRYFFDNVVLNKSCFSCQVRKQYSAADIRIGDFLGPLYEHREDGISAVTVISQKGADIVKLLKEDKRLVVVGEHRTEECLRSQSTEDYTSMLLRNNVIDKLISGDDIVETHKWYVAQFPFSKRVYLLLKKLITLLPNRFIVLMRRKIRNFK